jgi:hypothetical protein
MPDSYSFDKKRDNYSLGYHLQGIIPWGGITLAEKLVADAGVEVEK